MIFAYVLEVDNDSINKIPYHSVNKGVQKLSFTNDGEIVGPINPPLKGFDIYVFHGWTMWVSWGILGLIQLMTNRYLKIYWKYAIYIHGICGTISLILTCVAAFMMIDHMNWSLPEDPNYIWHPIMGLTVLTSVALISMGGIIVRLA